MITKVCLRCNTEKEITEYYAHKQMADGHLNICKLCKRTEEKNRFSVNRKNPDWVEKERERGREKFHRLYKGIKASPDAKKRAMDNYKAKFPEKNKARSAVGNFKIPVGKHGHHWSYNEEHHKDLIFIDISDHYTAHRFMIYDQERMMYRTKDGELLDTKERHIAYINQYIENKITN